MAPLKLLRHKSDPREELEIYRDLYTRIQLRAGQKHGGIAIGVTSATAGEGKTTTALNLARAFAEDRRLAPYSVAWQRLPAGASLNGTDEEGSRSRGPHGYGIVPSSDVLVVDCNQGRVRVGNELDVAELPGLTDHLSGSCSLADIIRQTDTPGLKVIPVGASPDALPVLISTAGMRALLEAVRRQFALIVVDLPAVLTGAETQAMSSLLDHLLIVVRSGKVSPKSLDQALDLIDRQKLIGMVLNDRRSALPNWIDQLL